MRRKVIVFFLILSILSFVYSQETKSSADDILKNYPQISKSIDDLNKRVVQFQTLRKSQLNDILKNKIPGYFEDEKNIKLLAAFSEKEKQIKDLLTKLKQNFENALENDEEIKKLVEEFEIIRKETIGTLFKTLNENIIKSLEKKEKEIKDLNVKIESMNEKHRKDLEGRVTREIQHIAEQVIVEIRKKYKDFEDELIEINKDIEKTFKTKQELDKKKGELEKKEKELKIWEEEYNKLNNNTLKKDNLEIALKELKKSNWLITVGLFITFNDKVQDNQYWVDSENFLQIDEEKGKAKPSLNLGVLLGYKIMKNTYLQTSIPLLNYFTGEGGDVSLFMKRTFGSVGVGYHPRDSKVLISLMFNFSRFYYIKQGIEEQYLTNLNPIVFPGDQKAEITYNSETYSNLFYETHRVSLSLGIALKF